MIEFILGYILPLIGLVILFLVVYPHAKVKACKHDFGIWYGDDRFSRGLNAESYMFIIIRHCKKCNYEDRRYSRSIFTTDRWIKNIKEGKELEAGE